ncbi:hypothetical protein PBT90_16720 [Algoriphagus halophytocola]|uniref:hypothetical protein n=1 Tax=Algoriphagus halophytocola TaxID=2991499 RepID=UPI0022DD2036|nr:hypothetical protein [Algoriphagus sp. TR-M9]WBL42381.1 hypothetical protein PBT90_16720 [Algoriphagus sp. TR-M9]
MENNEKKQVHLNVPQLLYWLVQARISICLWGRATGKTEGPGAMFTMNNMNTMPRSMGGILSSSYDKLLTMIVPGLVQGWEKFGYLENLHYFIRKMPPAGFFKDKPFREPKKSEHYIPWWNGSGAVIMSIDRPSTSVGINLDWMYADEARLFKEQSFNDALLTVRGNHAHFGHLSQHGSILITTDLPKDSRGKWLYRYLDEVDQETINLVIALQQKIAELTRDYDSLTKRKKALIDKEIAKMNAYCNEMRKELVNVSFASTLDNIHALGIDVIKRFRRMLSELDFQVSVLSKRLEQVEHGFYIGFNEDRNTYIPEESDWSYVDNLEIDFRKDQPKKDWRWDGDLVTDQPLDIALDYNRAISCMVIGQETIREDYIRNFMYVEEPLMLKDLIANFCEYYKGYPTKVVNYYYDHTALLGRNASSDIRHAEEVKYILAENDWTVVDHYIGQAPSHRSRYYLLNKLLKGDDPRLPVVKFHLNNTEDLVSSMNNTGTRRGTDGIAKDKRPEDDPNVKPIDAPHPTEALDQLLYGKHFRKLSGDSTFIETF